MKRILMIATLLILSLLLIGCVEKNMGDVSEPSVADTPDTGFPDDHWSKQEIEIRVDIMDGMSAPGGIMYLKDVPRPKYDATQAYEDGCCVQGFNSMGQSRYDEFYENAAKGIPGSLRLVYDLLDFSRVYDYEFDGEKFINRYYIVDDQKGLEYEQNSTSRPLREDEFGPDGVPVDSLYNGYNNDMQAAIDDGCIVLDSEYGLYFYSFKSVIHGQELWDEFFAKVNEGTPARVRICVNQAKLIEDVGFSEEEKELVVTQLEYDGRRFYAIKYDKENQAETCQRFNALVKGSKNGRTMYSLLMSDEYTWEEVDTRNEKVAISSSFGYDIFALPELTVFMK